MGKRLKLSSMFFLVMAIVLGMMQPAPVQADNKTIELGVEVLLSEYKDILKGKNVGLITNPTGVDQELNHIVDLLYNDPEINLVALYGPEHGVRGDAQAGSYVEFYIDETTGLPVYSLYGKTKKPTPEMLEDIDVLLFDIQDVGARFYTYIYTMAYAMESAQENGIEIVILDRPNPLGGLTVEGPVLEKGYETFVGLYPIPTRHGMTVGELAYYFNEEFEINADLTVIPMKNWKRSMFYKDTNLEFVLPSPNMPTEETVQVYPGLAIFEGTNMSEGRGTTKPFELIGAPFVNSTELAAELNKLNLSGVRFRAASFTPNISKHKGQLCHGVQIHITDPTSFNAITTGLSMVKTLNEMYPNDFEMTNFFDSLMGNGWVRQEILKGSLSIGEIEAKWQASLNEFKKIRENYLIYEAGLDTKALEKLLKEAEKVETDKYTKETVIVLENAIEEARTVLNKPSTVQGQINLVLEKLKHAINGLELAEEPVKPEVDKTELKNRIDDFEKFKEEDYTKDSFKVLKDAIKNAKKVLKDEKATKEDVDKALENLNLAIKGLEENNEKESETPEGPEESGKGREPKKPKESQETEKLKDLGKSKEDKLPRTGAHNMGYVYLIGILALGAALYIRSR